MRRRIHLLRHAEVGYLGEGGKPIPPRKAVLTPAGEAQARAVGALLRGVPFDRAITSGLPRTVESARLVLEGRRDAPPLESWPELEELRGGKLRDVAPDALEAAFLAAFRGAAPESARFLGGETIGSLFDRVLPALERLVADRSWDSALLVLHGGVNRAILGRILTGARTFLGHIEQAPACVNIVDVGRDPKAGEDWVVRAVNLRADDPLHLDGRDTTMERLYAQFRAALVNT